MAIRCLQMLAGRHVREDKIQQRMGRVTIERETMRRAFDVIKKSVYRDGVRLERWHFR